MNPFATSKPILPCRHIDEAFEIGRSDVASGASGSPLPCGCQQCAASYLEGVGAEINANKVIIETPDDGARKVS